jgi:hypothetical protein
MGSANSSAVLGMPSADDTETSAGEVSTLPSRVTAFAPKLLQHNIDRQSPGFVTNVFISAACAKSSFL